MKTFSGRFLFLARGALLAFYAVPVFATSPSTVYNQGKSAFEREDCLAAVKFLFAYQQLVGGEIDPGMNDKIGSAIAYCDEQILLAIRTKQDLDRYGQITEVVVESSGKADSGASHKTTKAYRPPQGKHVPKPALPSSPPEAKTQHLPSPRANEPLKIDHPLKKAEPVDLKKKNEALEKELALLKKRYELLQMKYQRRTETYDALKDECRQLLRQYKELKDRQE